MYAALLREHADELLRAVTDEDGTTYARVALTANALRNMADAMEGAERTPPVRGFFAPRGDEECPTCAA